MVSHLFFLNHGTETYHRSICKGPPIEALCSNKSQSRCTHAAIRAEAGNEIAVAKELWRVSLPRVIDTAVLIRTRVWIRPSRWGRAEKSRLLLLHTCRLTRRRLGTRFPRQFVLDLMSDTVGEL